MSLRRQALRGGRFLVLREGLGILVRTAGLLAVTGLIGPTAYGLFAGPLFLVQFLAVLATVGLDLYLIRRADEPDEAWYHQVWSFLLVSSLLVVGLGVAAADLVGAAVGDPRMVAPFQVLLLSVPLNILWIPARSRLERRFHYRKLAIAEVGADVAQYVLAVALALAGYGVWAAVYGFIARQGVMLVAAYLLARYLPRWVWRRTMLRELLAFGVPVSGAALARRAGDLVMPIVVGRFLGAAAVGVAALTIRLAETAGFVNRATSRLSVVTLGRVQRDLTRLRAAVEEGTVLQVLATGAVLVVFTFAVALLLPWLLGPEWEPAVRLLPFVAVNYLLMALFTTQNVSLMVLGRRWTLAAANLVALGLWFAAAWLLVPALGLPGYGIAQSISFLATWVKNRELRRIADVRYGRALPWFAALLPLLFVPVLPWWAGALAALPLIVVLALPGPRGELVGYARAVREVGGRAAPA